MLRNQWDALNEQEAEVKYLELKINDYRNMENMGLVIITAGAWLAVLPFPLALVFGLGVIGLGCVGFSYGGMTKDKQEKKLFSLLKGIAK